MLVQVPSIAAAGPAVSVRVTSIDIFRGLTMALMIFVNDLSGVKGLPWWNYHMPENANGMTYVDMVFPAFLFILGMSVPLAVEQRLKNGASMGQLLWHVVLRTLSLLILGLILANASKGDRRLMRLDGDTWALIALLGAVSFWTVYGRSERYRFIFRVLKITGLVLMVAMFAIFRRTTDGGHVAWIDISYWEILGLIGWSYLAASILYIPTRRWHWAPLAWFVALLLMNVLTSAKWITFPDRLPSYVWPLQSGALASIAMAGVVTSTIFLGETRKLTFRQKAIPALLFAGAVLGVGWVLMPLGISKIRATPSWCFYSVGSSVLLFTALFWICDVKKRTSWAAFVRPAGANALFTYLLPDFYYSAFGGLLGSHFETGWPGVAKSVLFTGVILVVAAVFTKWKVRLQL